ncbi:hypothetical protein C0995_011540 [Termitomyces sp. Mi166|nr:hypothetical protein C0995_011540 [Termitomyces sp. Mi166\
MFHTIPFAFDVPFVHGQALSAQRSALSLDSNSNSDADNGDPLSTGLQSPDSHQEKTGKGEDGKDIYEDLESLSQALFKESPE